MEKINEVMPEITSEKQNPLKYITISESFEDENLMFMDKEMNVIARLVEDEYNGEWHIHDFFEFELLISGNAKVYFEDKSMYSGKNDSWFCMPGSVQRVDTFKGTRLISIQFGKELIEDSIFASDFFESYLTAKMTEDDASLIYKSFLAAAGIAKKHKELARLAMKGFIEFITAFVIGVSDKRKNENVKSAVNTNILRAIRYSKFHISEDISVKNVAKLCGYTPNYFSALFKQEIGMGYNEFLRMERLRLANILLKNSDRSVGEIAFAVGFETSAYFCRVYKNAFGVTPTEYKRS